MLDRESLWQRRAGARAWPLAWAMILASGLPWVLPEDWGGELPCTFHLIWLAVGALFALMWLKKKHWLLPLGLALLAFTLWGLSRLCIWERQLPVGLMRMEALIAAPWHLEGERWKSTLELRAPEPLKNLRVPVSVPMSSEGEKPHPGSSVRLTGELLPVEASPPWLIERPLWKARNEGSPRRLRLRSFEQLIPLGRPNPSVLLRLQVWVHERFRKLPLPEDVGRSLWGALVLGLPPAREEQVSLFAESGTLHVLVVSGLQITLIMGFAEWLFRRWRFGGLGAAVLGLIYASIVGFSAPVWRGLLMGLAWLASRSKGWKVPWAWSLHLALLFWLLAHPASGAEPGFLLSWFALLGLLWASEPIAALWAPWIGDRSALWLARLSTPWLSTLPLLALFHGGAPVWGILANAVILPFVAILTPLCLLLTVLPQTTLCVGVAQLLGWIGNDLLPGFASIRPLGTAWLSPWLVLLGTWMLLGQRRDEFRRTRCVTLLALTGTLLLFALRGTWTMPRGRSLESIDVGQGDAHLIRGAGAPALLIDSGPSPWAARRIVRSMSRAGVREPLMLILTHPHGDHTGGWSTLERLWPIERVDVPATAYPEDPWAPFQPLVQRKIGTLVRDQSWHVGSAQLHIHWPPSPMRLSDANMVSIVLSLAWKGEEWWFMGDALDLQERDLLDLGEPGPHPGTRLVKLGHHGGSPGSDPAWLRALKPQAALVTAGARNPFGHPHPEALVRLGKAGIRQIWISGRDRGLQLHSDGRRWRWRTGRGEMGNLDLGS